MAGACDGLKVVDFSWGMTGGIATMVLADFGAEVIKVEPPRGDPFRSAPGFLLWNRGKKSVALDLKTDDGREQAHRLAEWADVVVESFRPTVADRLGIGYERLSEINPGLVYCSISGFGQKGPYRHYKGYEGVVAAKTARMMAFAGQTKRPGPVFEALMVGSHAASQAAVQGILAALLVREKTGRGQWVQTSLAQGLIPYDLGGLFMRQFVRKLPHMFQVDPFANAYRLPSLQYLPVQTKDGRWIQMANNMERLFQAWIRAIGLWELYEDPRFMNAPALTEENREIMRDILLRKMRERTLDEWMDLFIKDGNVAAEPFLSTQDGMKHDQVIWNRLVVDTEDPRVGKMKQLGVIADLYETPGEVRGPAPDLGQHSDEVLSRLGTNGQRAATNGRQPLVSPTLRHPLSGITVLELATVIAGPYSTVLLADLGARVIKIEPTEGDAGRHMGGSTGLLAVKTTSGKESICIDLKTEQGQAIVHKLIERADVLVHNYRPGVPERLGIDYETVKRINPSMVYIYVGAYGATGPHSARPGFHPIPGALLGGALWQAGRAMPPPPDKELTWEELKEVSRWLFRANEANPDPNTSMAAATAVMLGLYARSKTGKGQAGQVTMLGGNAYANADDFFSYEGKPERPLVDAECYGLNALYRLYEARESWVFLACVFEEEWQAFCRTIGRTDLLNDPRFATAEARRANDEALAQILGGIFAERPADEWEQMLIAADVACVRADGRVNPGDFFESDPHAWENGMIQETDHIRFGTYWRNGGLVHFSEMPGRFGPAVLAGQHTRQIMRELGYSNEEIEDYKRRGIVNWEEP